MDGMDTRVLIQMAADRAGSDDPSRLLEAATAIAAETGEAADGLVEHYVGAARAAGLSWTDIGDRLGVSRQAARQRFAHRLQVSDLVGDAADALIVAPRLDACLQAARTAARADDSELGTQHLLLGLLHAGVSAIVLDTLGVTRDKVRQSGDRLFEPAVITGEDGRERRVVGDGEGEAAVVQARRLAAQRGQSQVRTEHLLFCIALDPGSAARRVLNDLGVDLARLKSELREWIPQRSRSRRKLGKARRGRACSFCGCDYAGRPMVAGPGVWICGECVELATDILRRRQAESRPV